MKKTAKLETLVLSCDAEDVWNDVLADIPEKLHLKTLYLDSINYKSTIDMNQVKCNDSLENFYCSMGSIDHFAEFMDTHPNLVSVAFRGRFFEWSDEEKAVVAEWNGIIERAVKSPNLSMLSMSEQIWEDGDVPTNFPYMDIKKAIDWMSLYKAGIYDMMQKNAFRSNINMDFEDYYNTMIKR